MQLDDDIVEIRLHIITWLFDFFAWNGTGPLSAFKSPWTHLLIYRQKYLIGEILYKDDKRFLFCEENDTTTLCSLFAYLKCNED